MPLSCLQQNNETFDFVEVPKSSSCHDLVQITNFFYAFYLFITVLRIEVFPSIYLHTVLYAGTVCE